MTLKPMAWTAGVLVIVACAVFWPLVCHPADLLVGVQKGGRNDLTAHFVGFRMLSRAAVQNGHWPLWNPWIVLGEPWLGNPQSAMHYPATWLAAAVGVPAVLGWLMVLHQVWAGLGTYLLARKLDCEPLAAVAGGASATGAPFFLAQMGEGHFAQICVAAWIPWAFWAFENWRRGEPRSQWLLPLFLTAAAFAGHIQEVLYVAVALSLWCSLEIVFDLCTGRAAQAVRKGLGWVGVGALTAGLSAVEIAPIFAATKLAVRGRAFSVEEGGQISLDWDHLAQLIDPLALGGPQTFRGSGLFYWETLLHFGVLPLVLATWGAIAGCRRQGVVGWVVLALLTVLFAFGPRTPVYGLCHDSIPGISLFRAPSRVLFLTSVAVAVLAAVGLDEILKAGRKIHPRWGAATLGLLALGVTTAELHQCGRGLLRTVSPPQFRRTSELVQTLARSGSSGRILVRHEHLTDDEAIQHRLAKLPGYEPAPLLRTVDLFAALTDRETAPHHLLGFNSISPGDWNKPLLDLLGVEWLVTETPFNDLPGWTRVADGTVPPAVTLRGDSAVPVPYVLYRNTSALPRAFVVGASRTLEPREGLPSPNEWNPRETVLLYERDQLPAGRRSDFRPAVMRESGEDRTVIEVELEDPGYLVLSEAWAPGWKATGSDGQSLPVLRANHGLRAVPLSAGVHRITMTYRPPLWGVGAFVSLCAIAILTRLMLRSERRPS